MTDFFDAFQIMALILFLLIFVGRTLYLRLFKNVQAVTLGAGKKGVQRIIELSFFVGLLVWMIEIVLAALHIPLQIFPAVFYVQILNSIPLKVVGGTLIVMGFGLFIWALVSFGSSWRVGIDKKMPGQLVTTGLFSLSRNPIFVFIDLYFVGTFLINGTLIFLIFAVLVVLGLHYQIRQEEKFLSQTHGRPYQDYCAATGRYFMGV